MTSFNQQTPVVRDFKEFHFLERIQALAWFGNSIKIQFIVDEFLQHDPHTQMYLMWLENTTKEDIRRGSDITLEMKLLYDADSVVDISLYTKEPA